MELAVHIPYGIGLRTYYLKIQCRNQRHPPDWLPPTLERRPRSSVEIPSGRLWQHPEYLFLSTRFWLSYFLLCPSVPEEGVRPALSRVDTVIANCSVIDVSPARYDGYLWRSFAIYYRYHRRHSWCHAKNMHLRSCRPSITTTNHFRFASSLRIMCRLVIVVMSTDDITRTRKTASSLYRMSLTGTSSQSSIDSLIPFGFCTKWDFYRQPINSQKIVENFQCWLILI